MAVTLNGSGTITGVSSLATALVNPVVTTTMGVGNATPAATGSGVTFPAAQSASSDANTLDDYEEGSFTPVLRFGGASTGITYSNQAGSYVKVGKLVFVRFGFLLTSKGSATGAASISGLPFTCESISYADCGATFAAAGMASLVGLPYASPDNGATTVTLLNSTSSGKTNMLDTNFGNTTGLYGCVCYTTST